LTEAGGGGWFEAFNRGGQRVRKKGKGGAAMRRGVGRARGSAADVHRVYFDGACAPVNPGGIATFGWCLVDPDGRVIAFDAGEVCRGPAATNNIAEWHALLRALRFLADQGWKGRLQIHGDSQLVVNQLTGHWRCHKESLRRCRAACLELLEGMDWRADWVPREENGEADALARQVVPGSAGWPARLGAREAARQR
jgi:ribonuclease HI